MIALLGLKYTLFWLLIDILLLKHTGKQMHFVYKKIKPRVGFLKACFDPQLKTRLLSVFTAHPRLSVDLTSSGLRLCNGND